MVEQKINMEPEERRKSVRAEVFLIVKYRQAGRKVDYSMGVTTNVSSEGFNIESLDTSLEAGEILDIILKHPSAGLSAGLLGKIMWVRQAWYKYMLGIKFFEIDEENRKKISEITSAAGQKPVESFVQVKDAGNIPEHEPEKQPEVEIGAANIDDVFIDTAGKYNEEISSTEDKLLEGMSKWDNIEFDMRAAGSGEEPGPTEKNAEEETEKEKAAGPADEINEESAVKDVPAGTDDALKAGGTQDEGASDSSSDFDEATAESVEEADLPYEVEGPKIETKMPYQPPVKEIVDRVRQLEIDQINKEKARRRMRTSSLVISFFGIATGALIIFLAVQLGFLDKASRYPDPTVSGPEKSPGVNDIKPELLFDDVQTYKSTPETEARSEGLQTVPKEDTGLMNQEDAAKPKRLPLQETPAEDVSAGADIEAGIESEKTIKIGPPELEVGPSDDFGYRYEPGSDVDGDKTVTTETAEKIEATLETGSAAKDIKTFKSEIEAIRKRAAGFGSVDEAAAPVKTEAVTVIEEPSETEIVVGHGEPEELQPVIDDEEEEPSSLIEEFGSMPMERGHDKIPVGETAVEAHKGGDIAGPLKPVTSQDKEILLEAGQTTEAEQPAESESVEQTEISDEPEPTGNKNGLSSANMPKIPKISLVVTGKKTKKP